MSDGHFHISQGYDILQPVSGEAYPIPCDEWDFLKRKLGVASSSPWLFDVVGSVLLGSCLTTLITIIVGALPTDPQSRAPIIAWAVVAVTLICGLTCLFFAQQQRQVRSVQAGDVLTQMELIERRYPRVGTKEPSPRIKILSARYGASGKYADVTALCAGRVDEAGLRIAAENELAGNDPCPNILKELTVEYEHRGNIRTKTVREHEVLIIPS